MSLIDCMTSTLKGVYFCPNNQQRATFTNQLLDLEQSLTRPQILEVGLELLRRTGDGDAVQGYGAVLLRRALHAHVIQAADIPLSPLLSWYNTDPTLSRLLCSDLTELFVEYIIDARGHGAMEEIFQVVCASAEVLRQPRSLALVQLVLSTLLEPDFDRLSRERARELRSALLPHAESLLRLFTQVIYACFVQAGGESSTCYVDGTRCVVEGCLEMIAVLAPHVTLDVWSRASLADTLHALLRWLPAQSISIRTTAALLRSTNATITSSGGGNSGAVTHQGRAESTVVAAAASDLLRQLLCIIVEGTPSCVATEDIDTLNEIVQLLQELPRNMLYRSESNSNYIHSHSSPGICDCTPSLAHALLAILRLPSLYFANIVCALLAAPDSEVLLAHLPMLDLYAVLYELAPKNRFHPVQGSHPRGMALSESQLGFVAQYDAAFAEFRGHCGRVLQKAAQAQPIQTNAYLLQLLRGLSDPAGSAADRRTRAGYVIYGSPTYVAWEVVSFMLDNLSVSFPLCSSHLVDCLNALRARQPRDAVLTPLFLNMLSCFWRCCGAASVTAGDATAAMLLQSSVDVLFVYLEAAQADVKDADEAAAQRRAHTLLVTLCHAHKEQLAASLGHTLVRRIEPLLLRAHGQERSFLYEALMGATTVLPVAEGDAYLRSMITPMVDILQHTTAALDQASFNRVFIGATSSDRESRNNIRDSLSILAAVMRRCRSSAFVYELALRLMQILSHVAQLIHSVRAAELPGAFQQLFDVHDERRSHYLPGRPRESDVSNNNNNNNNSSNGTSSYNTMHRRDDVEFARSALMSIRLSVYQLFGALAPLLPAERFTPVLAGLSQASGVSSMSLPLQTIRSLTERCLFVIGESHTELLPGILSVLNGFYEQRVAALQMPQACLQVATLRGKRAAEDEIIAAKQWLFYTKDVMAYVRKHALDSGRWRSESGLLTLVCSLAVHMLACGSDTRNVLRLLTQLVQLAPDAAKPDGNAGAALTNAMTPYRHEIYTHLVRFVGSEDFARLPTPEKDSIAFGIAEPYIQYFPTLSAALEQAGVAQSRVEKLHAELLLASKFPIQRRKVKEFLLHLAA